MSRMRLIVFLLSLLSLPVLADAKTMYVRPYPVCANNGDGTAYACAASPGAVGAYRAFGGVTFGGGANQVSNGDTLYICGFHDGSWQSGPVQDAELVVTTTAIVDGNCPSDAGSILSANQKFTSGWTGPDSFGAYSRADGGCTSNHMAQLVNGLPTYLPTKKTAVPDSTWTDGSFYDDCVGNKYVRPLGGVSANSTTLYTTWGNNGLIRLSVAATVQNLTIYGLSSDACIRLLSGATGATVANNTMKWCSYAAIDALDGAAVDRVRVTGNTITQSGQGVIANATTTVNNNDAWIITGNTISDLDRLRRYTDYTLDNHGIGVAGGDNHLIADNIIDGLSGSCITVYDYPGQSMLNMHILRNRCSNVVDISAVNPPLNQQGIEYGSTNSGHVANDVAGGIVAGNLLDTVATNCFMVKTSQPTVGQAWVWSNNTAVNCGVGLMMTDHQDGNIGFHFHSNIISATTNIDHTQNGSDSLVNIRINNNLYASDSATAFEWNGTKSAFTAWKSNSSQDAASLQTNPLFVSATNYRLRATSPARNVGLVTGLCTDVRGRACRPDRRNMGAYETGSGDQAATRAARQ